MQGKQRRQVTKVCHFCDVAATVDAVRLQQHVAGFEVPVNDAAAVDVVHSLCNFLGRSEQRTLQRKQAENFLVILKDVVCTVSLVQE